MWKGTGDRDLFSNCFSSALLTRWSSSAACAGTMVFHVATIVLLLDLIVQLKSSYVQHTSVMSLQHATHKSQYMCEASAAPLSLGTSMLGQEMESLAATLSCPLI